VGGLLLARFIGGSSRKTTEHGTYFSIYVTGTGIEWFGCTGPRYGVDGRIFIAANRDAMIYDWKKTVEEQLPRIPNGVRVTYPMTGTAVLLPLSPENDYTPEVLICGGTTLDESMPPSGFSAKDPASDQCARMLLTRKGIKRGWQVDRMPQLRTMPNAVLLPTGGVVIVNGVGSSISG
jgi:hypothetical protein